MIEMKDNDWAKEFIIPAIDIIEGKCVRLSQGDYSRNKVYSELPLEMAKSFESQGFKRLHLVDLDGAKSGHIMNLRSLHLLASRTTLDIDFGGGVHCIDDVKNILDSGASMVTIGTLAVKQPGLIEEWVLEFGAEKFFVGADVLDGNVKVRGWLEDGNLTIFDMIRSMLAIGVNQLFCTDILRDGMLKGPGLKLYEEILSHFEGLNLVASGGVTNIGDVVLLREAGTNGVIVGKALYE